MTKSSSHICFQPLRADQLLFCTPTAHWLLKVNSCGSPCVKLEVTNDGSVTPLFNTVSADPPLRLDRGRNNVKHQHCANSVIIIWIRKHNTISLYQPPDCIKQVGLVRKWAWWLASFMPQNRTPLQLAISGRLHTSWQLLRAVNNLNALLCSPEKAQQFGK